MIGRLYIFFLLSTGICFSLAADEKANQWQKLEEGLYLVVFNAPQKSEIGDSRITILKINPHFYNIDIYCASQYGKKLSSAAEWGKKFKLTATINAGMYATDHCTAVGYLKSGSHLNNSRINKTYNSIFACTPLEEDIPPVQIIDRRCQDFSKWKNKYFSFLQSIRMISCQQKNVWRQQPKKWSIAALAMDKSGNLLFIHCRSPYSVHDFIEMLLHLLLNIYNAMYLEGGPAASLYFFAGGKKKELIGSYENSILLNDGNNAALQIPNVIGIQRKKK